MINHAAHETFMQASNAIAAYCGRAGLPDAGLDERQRLDLRIDDRTVYFRLIESAPPTLWIGCEIGAVDRGDRNALAWLLRAGAQPWLLRGQRIGLLPGAATAVIYTTINAAHADEAALASIVDGLFKAGAALGNKLDRCAFAQKLN